jgi:hypothetical protein
VSEFKRENKYIVIKLSKLNDNPILRNKQLNELNFFSDAFVESVVVESNKPEYQDVWAMVQARIEGKVNELNSLRQQLTKPADDTITVSKAEWEVVRSAMFKLAAQMAMKQNMPEVEHVNYSVNIPKKSWRSIQKMCSKSTQQCNDWSYELRQAIDKVSSAIQGESK